MARVLPDGASLTTEMATPDDMAAKSGGRGAFGRARRHERLPGSDDDLEPVPMRTPWWRRSSARVGGLACLATVLSTALVLANVLGNPPIEFPPPPPPRIQTQQWRATGDIKDLGYG